MKRNVIIDTGPIVAFINARDKHHEWSKEQFSRIAPPLLTCESVISEACFLLRDIHNGSDIILELLKRGVINLPFKMEDSLEQIKWLLNKYSNVPMSLADACLVRMSEIYPDSSIFTLDNDFGIYRKNRRNVIRLLTRR
ncbi:MAG: PIN domain-containing protein [Deltaproteobacteria bacterium]|nr:PIN domain-containing protein [Deltaproteobacteria bacterium]